MCLTPCISKDSARLDVCIDQMLAQVLSLYQRALHVSGCHVSKPDPILCAHSHTRCGQPYHRPPLLCPHSPNQLVSFRVLAPSADRADLVNCDMTTDADTLVSNQTLLSPLCLCYRYAPYCTARTTHSTAVAHVLRIHTPVHQTDGPPKVLQHIFFRSGIHRARVGGCI